MFDRGFILKGMAKKKREQFRGTLAAAPEDLIKLVKEFNKF